MQRWVFATPPATPLGQVIASWMHRGAVLALLPTSKEAYNQDSCHVRVPFAFKGIQNPWALTRQASPSHAGFALWDALRQSAKMLFKIVQGICFFWFQGLVRLGFGVLAGWPSGNSNDTP